MAIKQPLVSIVIPTYNGANTIGETIQSVIKQTYDNYEVFILNNCSEDNTLEIARSFKDDRIHIINNETNIGFKNNWNKTLNYIRGKYYKLIPDDDILDKFNLEYSVNILEHHENVVLVSSKRTIIDENSKKVLTIGKRLGNSNLAKTKKIKKYIARYGANPIGEPGATLIRKTAITNNTKFDTPFTYFIDLDFYLKILRSGDYYFIDQPLYSFRVWRRSYSIVNQKKQLVEAKQFYNNLFSKNPSLTNYDKVICSFNLYKTFFLKKILYKLWL